MAIFVTAFDEGFWIKGLTSLRSFKSHSQNNDKIVVVPLEKKTASFFIRNFDHLAVYISEEKALPEKIRRLQQSRNFVEYACTIKPFVLEHALSMASEDEWVFWFDADSEFFSDPALIYHDVKQSVFLSCHRYSKDFAQYESGAGKFNGGLIGFKNNPEGKRALKWWAERCEEDCPNIPTEDKYLDQKYLNRIPELFDAHQDHTPGINDAPWNLDKGLRISTKEGKFFSSGKPLIYFHFQGLKILNRKMMDCFAGDWSVPVGAYAVYRHHAASLGHSLHALGKFSQLSARNFQKTSYKGLLKRLLGWKKGLKNLAMIP